MRPQLKVGEVGYHEAQRTRSMAPPKSKAEQIVAAYHPEVDRQEGEPRPHRRGYSGEESRRLMRLLAHIDLRVEPRQPERAADRECQRGEPADPRQVVERPQEEDQRRRRAEREIVRQSCLVPRRSSALASKRAMRPSIPSSTPAPRPRLPPRASPRHRKADAGQARAHASGGDGVGRECSNWEAVALRLLAHWLAPLRFGSTPTSPRTVSRRCTVWPSRTLASVPAGK